MVAHVKTSAAEILPRVMEMGVLALHSILITVMACVQTVRISSVGAGARVAKTVHVARTTATERITVVRMAAGAQMGSTAVAFVIND